MARGTSPEPSRGSGSCPIQQSWAVALVFCCLAVHLQPLFFAVLLFACRQDQGVGGGIRPQAGSSLCCAETLSSRKLKFSNFYHVLTGFHFEHKPVLWDIHCCHGNAIVEECLELFWLKLVENWKFLLKMFSNFNLSLPFVISISKLPLYQISYKSDEKQKSCDFLLFSTQTGPKIQDDIIKMA